MDTNTALRTPRGEPTLQALHLAALRAGTVRELLRVGDAEGLLWCAPERRILRRTFRDGALQSEIHVLLDAACRPLAWWQRCSGASRTGAAAAASLAHRMAHVTVVAIDGPGHDLGVAAVHAEISALAGRSASRRRAVFPVSRVVVPLLSSPQPL